MKKILSLVILGLLDGQFNPTAWQTEAFWSNPLTGFSIQ